MISPNLNLAIISCVSQLDSCSLFSASLLSDTFVIPLDASPSLITPPHSHLHISTRSAFFSTLNCYSCPHSSDDQPLLSQFSIFTHASVPTGKSTLSQVISGHNGAATRFLLYSGCQGGSSSTACLCNLSSTDASLHSDTKVQEYVSSMVTEI